MTFCVVSLLYVSFTIFYSIHCSIFVSGLCWGSYFTSQVINEAAQTLTGSPAGWFYCCFKDDMIKFSKILQIHHRQTRVALLQHIVTLK